MLVDVAIILGGNRGKRKNFLTQHRCTRQYRLQKMPCRGRLHSRRVSVEGVRQQRETLFRTEAFMDGDGGERGCGGDRLW